MIDIHNHILPNVDDGPEVLEESIDLLKQAKSENVDKIIVTPHHLHKKFSNDFNKIEQALHELKKLDEVQEIGIKLYPGQELRITDQIITGIEDGTIKGLNSSRYLLIEFPSNEVPYYTNSLFFEIQNKGYIPIIAHPERNKAISQNPDLLYELVRSGALSQITTSSLNGNNGKRIQNLCLDMIDNNLTHFIASDAHSCSIRPFLMNDLFKNKKLISYKEEISKLIQNGELIISNDYITKDIPDRIEKRKRLFGFL